MSQTVHSAQGPSLEECIDELEEFIGAAGRYPPGLMAFALRTHLGSLLHALLREGSWSADEVRDFLDELRREVLHGE